MAEQRVGLIGWPVEHSISPAMHNAAFAALGLTEWRYDKMAIPPDVVKLSLRELRQHGYIGVNVTVPHKGAVLPFVQPDEAAKAIGAVNTIDFRDNRGTNTDVSGFMSDLAAHGVDVAGKKVIVLGAGGAARAAVYGLHQAGAQIAIANRTPDKARFLAQGLGVDAQVIRLADAAALGAAPLEADLLEADLVVNCTTVGMWPRVDESPWPADIALPRGAVVYDMIYRPARTRLMAQAEAAGLQAVGGLGMLARQGAAAFALWTGQDAPLEVMFAAAHAALGE